MQKKTQESKYKGTSCFDNKFCSLLDLFWLELPLRSSAKLS